jgi:apolipoprotein N-acyltransferase
MTSHCSVFPHLRARDLTAIAMGSVLSLGQPDPSWGLLVLFLLPPLWCWRQVAVAWGSLGFFVASLNGVMWLDTSLPEACFGEVVMMTRHLAQNRACRMGWLASHLRATGIGPLRRSLQWPAATVSQPAP